MTILGIDPSISKLGWAVISDGGSYIASGRFVTKSSQTTSCRLLEIYNFISNDIIKKFQPKVIAIETGFLKKDMAAVEKLSYVRSIIMLLSAKAHTEFIEIAPKSIKKTITGTGNATKEQVRDMIMRIFTNIEIENFDESDAIGIAYSGYITNRFYAKGTIKNNRAR